jgi:hypothetical protein
VKHIETFLYLAPSMFCRKCMTVIPLPYSHLPQIDHGQWYEEEYTGPMDSVPDKWSVLFGCRECGHVETYPGWHVGDSVVEKETQGVFHNETNCYSVKLQCARVECKLAILHVNLKNDEAEKDLLRLLKSAFFVGQLPVCASDNADSRSLLCRSPSSGGSTLVDTRALL